MAEKVLGNLSKGLVFILSAPAGTGKTTLVRMLSSEFPCVVESVSSTTREVRPGEVEGKDYFFLSPSEFEKKIKADEFLEYAKVFNHYYGTSKEYVKQQQEKGRHVFLVIDTQGAMQLKKKKLDAIYIFLAPPSIAELRERLLNRKTDTEKSIEERLSWAQKEMEMAIHYDYEIVNKNLHIAYDILRSIVIAEEHRVQKS